MMYSSLLVFCVATTVSSLHLSQVPSELPEQDLQNFEDMAYSGIFTEKEESALQRLSVLSLHSETTSFAKINSNSVNSKIKSRTDNPKKVVFLWDRKWESTIPRGDEMALILKSMGHNAKVMNCGKFCDSGEEVDVLVHIKHGCACAYEKADENVYDPIDNMEKYDELAQWTKVLAGTNAMRDKANHKSSAVQGNQNTTITMPHHHSNFQKRQHKPSKGKPLMIGIAGARNALSAGLSKRLETCLKNTLGEEGLSKVDPVAKTLEEVQCDCMQLVVQGQSQRGDCFAMKLAQFDIGIVWQQSENQEVLRRKPPQRLANVLAVGIPAVAHSAMHGHKDAKEIEESYGGESIQLADDEGVMCEKIKELVLNDTLRKKASEDALKVAEEYSPMSIGDQYIKAFEFWYGK